MSTAVMERNKNSLQGLLDRMQGELKKVLPAYLTPERMIRIALTAVGKTPKLQECTPISVVACVMEAAQLGLELNTPLGHAYMVPYKTTAQFQIGYKGYLKMTQNSGDVSYVDADCVYEGDEFKFSKGLHPDLRHVPCGEDDPDKITHAYAIAVLKDGKSQFVVLPRVRIERYRARSRAKDQGPWVTDYDAMCMKTAIRRLAKLLPLSVEVAERIVKDEKRELGIVTTTAVVGDSGVPQLLDMDAEGESRTDQAEKQIEQKKPGKGKKAQAKQIAAITSLAEQLSFTEADYQDALAKYDTVRATELTEEQAEELIGVLAQELETKKNANSMSEPGEQG